MDENYWNCVATDYDNEIFSVIANDRRGIISSTISRLASKKLLACDFGCGVGKFLPTLSRNFRRVYAVDISDVCLDKARENCRHLPNVTFSRADLSCDTLKLRKAHFALSVNAVMMTSHDKRAAVFDTIARHLYKGAHLLLVVPSLESALFADFRLLQWNVKTGLTHRRAVKELDGTDTELALRQGILEIDGVPTKHYLEEELCATFKESPLDVLSIEKVEYPWSTEFQNPPNWMKAPYPWDWMAVMKKT